MGDTKFHFRIRQCPGRKVSLTSYVEYNSNCPAAQQVSLIGLLVAEMPYLDMSVWIREIRLLTKGLFCYEPFVFLNELWRNLKFKNGKFVLLNSITLKFKIMTSYVKFENFPQSVSISQNFKYEIQRFWNLVGYKSCEDLREKLIILCSVWRTKPVLTC